jgi:hypothetical protein
MNRFEGPPQTTHKTLEGDKQQRGTTDNVTYAVRKGLYLLPVLQYIRIDTAAQFFEVILRFSSKVRYTHLQSK